MAAPGGGTGAQAPPGRMWWRKWGKEPNVSDSLEEVDPTLEPLTMGFASGWDGPLTLLCVRGTYVEPR